MGSILFFSTLLLLPGLTHCSTLSVSCSVEGSNLAHTMSHNCSGNQQVYHAYGSNMNESTFHVHGLCITQTPPICVNFTAIIYSKNTTLMCKFGNSSADIVCSTNALNTSFNCIMARVHINGGVQRKHRSLYNSEGSTVHSFYIWLLTLMMFIICCIFYCGLCYCCRHNVTGGNSEQHQPSVDDHSASHSNGVSSAVGDPPPYEETEMYLVNTTPPATPPPPYSPPYTAPPPYPELPAYPPRYPSPPPYPRSYTVV